MSHNVVMGSKRASPFTHDDDNTNEIINDRDNIHISMNMHMTGTSTPRKREMTPAGASHCGCCPLCSRAKAISLVNCSILPRSRYLLLNHKGSWLQKWCWDSLLGLVDQDSGEWIAKELEVRFVTPISISRLICDIAVVLGGSKALDHVFAVF
jgi:hypothetical protein